MSDEGDTVYTRGHTLKWETIEGRDQAVRSFDEPRVGMRQPWGRMARLPEQTILVRGPSFTHAIR